MTGWQRLSEKYRLIEILDFSLCLIALYSSMNAFKLVFSAKAYIVGWLLEVQKY